ncbi:MAG: hypothetical protein JXA15_02740 [Spirochaetales bacterium]|nr:hypothetical protein [Spirochaetales bacterium]
MKSTRIAAFAIASVFLLGSCDAILGFNLFEGMAQAGVVDNIRDAETAEDFLAESDAENFIEALEETEKVEEAITALEEVYAPSDPSAPPAAPTDVQEAAAVAAEIIIYTSPAGEVVDNIIEVAAGNPAALEVDNPAGLIRAIIPPEISGDPVAFEETILAFLDAWEAYAALGESIVGGALSTDAVVAGDLVIAAAIGAALDALVTAQIGEPPVMTYEEARDDIILALFDAANGGTPALPEFATVTQDGSEIPTFLADGSPLANILLAAGIDTSTFTDGGA